MVYSTGKMVLLTVREVIKGAENDVVVCRDTASPFEAYYTVVVIHNRECARRVLSVFENSERILPDGEMPYIDCFTYNELLCYVFPFRAERRLSLFAASQVNSAQSWERACIGIVMECLSSPLPYPLLALAISQGNLHIEKDFSAYITPYFDLTGLAPQAGEAHCTRACVETMLAMPGTFSRKLKSAELMRKKLSKNAHRSLPELYRDIKVTAISVRKTSLGERLKRMWQSNRDGLFRVLLIICGAVAALALLVFLSQLLFGDIFLFRLLKNCFGQIGTRKLS